ncbi:uncharacterized protein B0P05DRAFT_575543 [Gilbertella persicaria]|uniref:uncharacterized protein n=1 Tax=Gilbertella persicaria TaxID=101096 RepID=UPI002220CC45|nr:uncharacterized protein B0P05DRAFT_575543 [Gilbertella persicaria]KAI8053183.1 hypothetical protein B0P05DRAFT_575543 [Gilbertella persicaria]
MFVSMAPKDVDDIVIKYGYQYVCQGEAVWPEQKSLEDPMVKRRIDELCLPLKNKLNARVSIKSLADNPGSFFPLLFHILAVFEREHQSHKAFDVRRLPLPRLFNVFPSSSCHWRSVIISVNALAAFLPGEPLPRGYNDQLHLFYKVFDFKPLRIKSIESLLPTGTNKRLFGNLIRSDGFSVDFVFNKRTITEKRLTKQINQVDLILDGFEQHEVDSHYLPIAVDPGRKRFLTVFAGSSGNINDFRQCSIKEYYHLTGSTKFSAEQERKKKACGIKTIETNIPTNKTANESLFYNQETAKETFFLYQGRQRAPERMVKMFLDGTKKYNKKSRGNKRKRAKNKGKRKKKGNKSGKKDKGKRKMAPKTTKTSHKFMILRESNFFQYKQKVPLIVSGSGMFGKNHVKIKTVRTGVTGPLYRTLKRRERTGDLLVVDIDEYLTS